MEYDDGISEYRLGAAAQDQEIDNLRRAYEDVCNKLAAAVAQTEFMKAAIHQYAPHVWADIEAAMDEGTTPPEES